MKIQDQKYQEKFNYNCEETLRLLHRLHKIKRQRSQNAFLANIGVCIIAVLELGFTVLMLIHYIG